MSEQLWNHPEAPSSEVSTDNSQSAQTHESSIEKPRADPENLVKGSALPSFQWEGEEFD